MVYCLFSSTDELVRIPQKRILHCSVMLLKDSNTFNKTDERKVAPWEKHIK